MSYDARARGAQCDRCPLRESTPVPPEPNKDELKFIVVAEGPGKFEALRGRPLIGYSGRMLDAELSAVGLRRENGWLTNAVLCFNGNNNDKELEAAIPCCAPRLARELSELPRELPILSLGAGASKVTIGKGGIQKYRGFVWKAPEIKPSQLKNAQRLYEKRAGIIAVNKKGEKKKASRDKVRKALDSWEMLKARAMIVGRTIMPTYHPAYILRGADTALPVMRIDLERLAKLLRLGDKMPLEDAGPFEVTSDPRRARQLLRAMSDTVNVDIETDNVDPMRLVIKCVGIADVKDTRKIVLISPWKDRRHAPALRRALKNRTVVTHNGWMFDNIALKLRGITYAHNEDTLVAHRVIASHMPQSLAHVASVFCDTGPWKVKFKSGEEKGAVAGLGVRDEDLPEYCAADVRLGSLAWLRMQPELAKEYALYREDMEMAALYTSMQMTGIRVDQARRAALSKKLRYRAHALVGEMRKLVNRRGFAPGSHHDIRKALFGQFNAPIWLAPLTKTGLPSTKGLVLESLREQETRAGKLADYIIRWRSANDSRSEYLDGIHIHPDGCVHAAWKQVETGRPACRAPNLLNLPKMAFCQSKGCGVKLIDGVAHTPECKKHDEPQPEEQLRDIYIARPGHNFIYFDGSQIEMRFAAHISADPVFMKACDGDIHMGNACALWPDLADRLRAEPKGFGFKFRQMAKQCGFAVTYVAEAPKLFATLHNKGFDVGMEEVEAMLDSLHTSYRVYFQYVDEQLALAQKRGWLRIPFSNRIRYVGHFPKIGVIANSPVQGGVAGVMNKRLLLLEKRKTKHAKLIYYWYDAAIFDTPKDECADMERIIKEVWAEPIAVPHNGVSFVQPIEFKLGERLSDF
jgi:uracil-DNA glycosylase family 4